MLESTVRQKNYTMTSNFTQNFIIEFYYGKVRIHNLANSPLSGASEIVLFSNYESTKREILLEQFGTNSVADGVLNIDAVRLPRNLVGSLNARKYEASQTSTILFPRYF